MGANWKFKGQNWTDIIDKTGNGGVNQKTKIICLFTLTSITKVFKTFLSLVTLNGSWYRLVNVNLNNKFMKKVIINLNPFNLFNKLLYKFIRNLA